MISKATFCSSACVLFTCLTFFARAGDVDVILDKAEQALGGHAVLSDIQSIRTHSHGTWQMPSRSIPATPYEIELVFRRPNQVKVLWKFPEEMGGEFYFGYDGKDAWGEYGGPPARCKGWHREVILQLVAEPQLYLIVPARAEHEEAFSLDTTSPDEHGLVKMIYHPFSTGNPWNVSFDAATGLLAIVEHDSYQMDGQLARFRSMRSEPKGLGDLKYPSRAKYESKRGDTVIESGEETIDSIEINPQLPKDFFACPKWKIDTATTAVKEISAETVVTFEHRGPYAEIGKSLGPMMDVIMASGLVPTGPASATYLSDPSSSGEPRAELAVRVAKVTEGKPSLPTGYEFTTRPAMSVAFAYHRGDHMQEGEAHSRLRAWMSEQGLQPAGPLTAIWFHDPEVTVQEDLITEVQIPARE